MRIKQRIIHFGGWKLILYSEMGRAGEIGKGTESFYHAMESPSLLLPRLLSAPLPICDNQGHWWLVLECSCYQIIDGLEKDKHSSNPVVLLQVKGFPKCGHLSPRYWDWFARLGGMSYIYMASTRVPNKIMPVCWNPKLGSWMGKVLNWVVDSLSDYLGVSWYLFFFSFQLFKPNFTSLVLGLKVP